MLPPGGVEPTKTISCRSPDACHVTVPFAAMVSEAGENVRAGVVTVAADGVAGADGVVGGVAGGVPVSGGFGSEIGAAPPPPHA
jgi:hypothetical protein